MFVIKSRFSAKDRNYLLKRIKCFKKKQFRGTREAQSVECPTLGFGSGHDLRVLGLSPGSGSTFSRESA